MYQLKYFTEKELRIEGVSSYLKKNMYALVENCTDPIRKKWGKIKTLSAYRDPVYNKMVGGVDGSQHVEAKAKDIFPLEANIKDVYLWSLENIDFDQMIFEKSDTGSQWIHISYNSTSNRKQALIANKKNGKWKYLPFVGF